MLSPSISKASDETRQNTRERERIEKNCSLLHIAVRELNIVELLPPREKRLVRWYQSITTRSYTHSFHNHSLTLMPFSYLSFRTLRQLRATNVRARKRDRLRSTIYCDSQSLFTLLSFPLSLWVDLWCYFVLSHIQAWAKQLDWSNQRWVRKEKKAFDATT